MQTGTIDAGRLRKELETSWRSVGQVEAGAGSGVLRACSMTLIVLTDESEDAQTLGESLAQLNHEYPSRTIVVRACSTSEHPFEGRVLVQCWRPAGKRQQICCEQIELLAPLAKVGELESVILGLTVPDLPVVLLSRRADLLQTQLLGLAHKVIVDGARCPSAIDAIQQVEGLIAGGHRVGDLAWTRITRWREILSRVFRNWRLRGRAPQVQRIEVSYAGPGMPATACYLAAWLLQVFRQDECLSMVETTEDQVSQLGRIRSVRLSGSSIDVCLTRPVGTHVAVVVDGLETALLFPQLTPDELLREEVGILGHDEAFVSAMTVARRVLGCTNR